MVVERKGATVKGPLLGAPGISTRSILTTSNKKLLVQRPAPPEHQGRTSFTAHLSRATRNYWRAKK